MRVIEVTSLAIAAIFVSLFPGFDLRADEEPEQPPVAPEVRAKAGRTTIALVHSEVLWASGPPRPGFEQCHRQVSRLDPAAGRATGVISGRITDSSTGAGVSWARVDIYDTDNRYLLTQDVDFSGYYTTSTGLETGIYYATTVNWLGYYDELYDDLPCTGFCDVSAGTPIAVTDGATTSINFALDPGGGNVSGTITDGQSGTTLGAMGVDIYDASGRWITYGWGNAFIGYTTRGGLPPGTYYARTTNGIGYLDELYDDFPCTLRNCDPTTGTPILVNGGSPTSDINFVIEKGGVISGTVTDSSTDTPISDLGVDIYDSSGNRFGTVWTGVSGDYTTGAGLPTGTYYAVTVNSFGYYDELYENLPCTGQCDLTVGTPIAVTAGSTTADIDFALDPGNTISGTITDNSTGTGLGNFRIDIYDLGAAWVTKGYTDSAGGYTTRGGLPTGNYYVVSLNVSGYYDELYEDLPCTGACDVTLGTPVAVVEGSQTAGIDFALDPGGGNISGTITDSGTGKRLSGLEVDIYDSNGQWITRSALLGPGDYTTLGGLPTGAYYARTSNSIGYLDKLYDDFPCESGNCDPTTGTSIVVNAGSTTAGVDFALEAQGVISGTVTDSATGAALSDVEVDIYDSNGNLFTKGWTDANGNYSSSDGLPIGTYYAGTVNWAGYYDELYDNLPCTGGCKVTAGTPIAVTADAATGGIDFALDPGGGRISGTVTDSLTPTGLSAVTVDIYDATGNRVTGGHPDASGSYTTQGGLPAGTYYARTANSIGYLDELYDDLPCVSGDCDITTGTGILVGAGAMTSGIDFALDPGGGVSGTVTDTSRAVGVSNVRVSIYDGGGNSVADVWTDGGGNYITAEILRPGSFYAATENSQGYFDELYDNLPCTGGCDPTTGAPIAVAGSMRTGINFALATGGAISGTVTDGATAAAVSGVRVDIFDAGGNIVTWGSTDGYGNYTTGGGLATGTYFAVSSATRHYNKLYAGLWCFAGCDPTTGTAISVTAGAVTTAIDFALDSTAGLVAAAQSATQVKLRWIDPNAGEVAFRIERSPDGASWTPFQWVEADITTYLDHELSPATLYYYRVVPYSALTDATPSNVAAATTFPAVAAKVCRTRLGADHEAARYISVAHNGTQWAAAWQDARGGEGGEIFFQLLDQFTAAPVGSPIQITDSDTYSQYPTLRWNGTHFGLFWFEHSRMADGRSAFPGGFFALLDANGNKVRGNVRISAGGNHRFYVNSNPVAAVVWLGDSWGLFNSEAINQPRDMVYYRIDEDGDLLAGPVQVTNTTGLEYNAATAWNGSELGFSWTYREDDFSNDTIYFQRLHVDGTLLGTPVEIWSSASGLATVHGISVVWDGSAWVLTYGEILEAGRLAIFLRRLDATGTPLGPAVRISDHLDPDYPPVEGIPVWDFYPVLVNKPGGGFAIFNTSLIWGTATWEVGRLDADADGNKVGTRILLSDHDGWLSGFQRAATDGSNFLVAYNDCRQGTLEVAVVQTNANGAVVAGPNDVTSGHSVGNTRGLIGAAHPRVIPFGEGFVTLWSDDVSGNRLLQAQIFDGSGAVAATRFPLSTRTVASAPAGVAVGETFAVAWKESGSGRVIFDRYDASGNSLLGEVEVTTTASSLGVGMAFNGEIFGLVWVASGELIFQRVVFDGTPVGAPITVPSNRVGYGPQIEWVGSGWALLWMNTRDQDLYYSLLAPDGAVLVPAVQVTNTTQYGPYNPHLLWTGDYLGLGWSEYSYGYPSALDVYFTVLGLDGIKAFPEVTAVNNPNHDYRTVLYWAGDRFRLVFQSGLGGIREIEVLPDGTVVPGERILANHVGTLHVASNGVTAGLLHNHLGNDMFFETLECVADTTPPSAPVLSGAFHGGTVSLSWPPVTDPESGVLTYYVYRDGSLLAELFSTTTGFTDGGFGPDSVHTYEVRAMNGAYLESEPGTVVVSTTYLFRDGFESGDTSAWSATVP